jgi:hypothetical protein
MVHDSITEEIRAIRHSLADKFGNDVTQILADVRRQQEASGRKFILLPKRQPRTLVVAEQKDAPERE